MSLSDVLIVRYAKCAGMAQEFELRMRLFYEARLNKPSPARLQDVIDGAPLSEPHKQVFHRARLLRNKLDHGEFWTAETRAEAISGRAPRKVDVQVYDALSFPVIDVVNGNATSLGSHRNLDERMIYPWLISSTVKDGLFDEAEAIFDQAIQDIKTS